VYAVVGLGNPEDSYKGTRHNVGFETVNKLCFDHKISIRKYKRKCRAYVGEGNIGGIGAVFAKPQTYMNLSGESARAILDFYKIPPSGLIVVCDDVNLPAGDVRVREKGGAGGHNGLKNIISRLSTEEFIRVRIGIGAKPEGSDLAGYVLGRVGKGEFDTIVDGITRAGRAVETIMREGVGAAMCKFNKKAAAPSDAQPAAEDK